MASPPRITILGSLNIDLVARVPHHPLPGETLTASSFNVSPGGKGANQAVACAKLSRSAPPSTDPPSAAVSMVGAVGSDSYGSLLRENLQKHGVDVEGVIVREGEKTGIAIIVVDEPTGENRIVLSGEANHEVTEQGVGLEGVLGRTDLLIMQLEIPVRTVLAALEGAKEKGVEVLFNPAPAQVLPEGWLKGLGHLVVNETEAALLGGVEVGVLDDEAGCEKVARGFVEKGAVNVIITLGGRGVYYLSGDGRKGLVPAEKAKVVDTTAAGDTFVGQYALEVVGTEKGARFDIESAVRKANRAAAKTVQRKGAQDSIPWRDELV
ncbi:Ribokinase-like protein [Podospora aff. communis PSN243]|uniref:Ribokinase n=1 Tax=Podospora aff. communis PSN243 TaxID=3040156 RepID=A0AAV9H2D4_9PEZI|nr:Ribokinase-like protein [Podospora aff. communis PSN243]